MSGTFSSDAAQPKEEIENIRYAIQRSRPYGWKEWVSSGGGAIRIGKHPAEPRATRKRYLTPFSTPTKTKCPSLDERWRTLHEWIMLRPRTEAVRPVPGVTSPARIRDNETGLEPS